MCDPEDGGTGGGVGGVGGVGGTGDGGVKQNCTLQSSRGGSGKRGHVGSPQSQTLKEILYKPIAF